MDMFSEITPNQEIEIPDKIPAYKLSRAERAAILKPDLEDINFDVSADVDSESKPPNQTQNHANNHVNYDAMCGAMSLAFRRNYGLLASFRVMGVQSQNYQRALSSAAFDAVYLPLVNKTNNLAGVFMLDVRLVSALVEVACGGSVDVTKVTDYQLGHWNRRLIKTLLTPMVDIWAVDASIESVDAGPEFCHSLAPSRDVDKVLFSAKFNGLMGQCALVLDTSL